MILPGQGADFILKIKQKKIVIEVGYGEKKFKQVRFTLKGIKGDYGLLLSESQVLRVRENVLNVPIHFLLLI